MKKIISILLILSIFVIVWLQSSMASFVMNNNSEMDMSNMKMSSNDCCEQMQKDCSENKHECCYSPFQESSITTNIQFKTTQKEKLKVKILDYSFLAILNENLQINYIEKLSSPPDESLVNWLENTYTILTGITKSNC